MLQPYPHSDKTVTIKAIETFYAGCRFRSRLEARWAVLLDTLGIRWVYEHQGYATEHGAYLPVFWLPDLNTILEIKAHQPSWEETSKLQAVIDDQVCFGAFGFSFDTNKHISARLPVDSNYDSVYPWPAGTPRPEHVFMFEPSALAHDGEWDELYCPACGAENVHHGKPLYLTEDYPHKHVHSRGPITSIPMYSENCHHEWELVVAFHKGTTSMVVCLPFDGNFTPLELAINGPQGPGAIRAALSARFEHGETP
jgi:hypothetical protein